MTHPSPAAPARARAPSAGRPRARSEDLPRGPERSRSASCCHHFPPCGPALFAAFELFGGEVVKQLRGQLGVVLDARCWAAGCVGDCSFSSRATAVDCLSPTLLSLLYCSDSG